MTKGESHRSGPGEKWTSFLEFVRASLTLSSRNASDSLQTISSDDPTCQGQISRYPITQKTIESALWAILASNLLQQKRRMAGSIQLKGGEKESEEEWVLSRNDLACL